MAGIVIIKVSEKTGKDFEATDSQLGLSGNQLYIVSLASIKLSWNFKEPKTNLLDWIGMFELGKLTPILKFAYLLSFFLF